MLSCLSMFASIQQYLVETSRRAGLANRNEPASHTQVVSLRGFAVLSLGGDRLEHAPVFVVGMDEKHS